MKDFSKKLHSLIFKDFEGLNLTSIKDPKDFYILQVKDSIAPINESRVFKQCISETSIILDVGFGGGFPILPLAYMNTKKQFIGIDSKRKKVDAVNNISEKLDLSNVKTYHHRIEDILVDVSIILTFKAVGKINNFLKKINTTKTIQVFFYKGPSLRELEDVNIEGWKLIEDKEYNLMSNIKRTFVGYENKKVPCGTFNKNHLVKVSSLL